MKIIETNELEKFCVLSSEIISSKKLSSDHFLECVNLFSNKNLNKNDKIRLLFIILKQTAIQKPEYIKLEKALLENSEINEKEKIFLLNLKNENYKNENTSNTFLSSLKNSSTTFLKNMISNIYQFKTTQLINGFFKNNNYDLFEIVQIDEEIKIDLNNLKNFNDVIVLSINGGNLNEFSELLKLEKDLKKNIIYAMDFLKSPQDILEGLINQ